MSIIDGFWPFSQNLAFSREKVAKTPRTPGAPPLRSKFRKLSLKKLRDMHFRLFEPFLALFLNFCNKKLSGLRPRCLPSRGNALKFDFPLQYAPCETHRLAVIVVF